jgi:hypothetical protein
LTSEAPNSGSRPAAWCAAYFAIVLAIIAMVAGVNYLVDFYGLFRDSSQRPIRLYANERTGKYLLGFRYIPANFQGIVIGTSVTQNWNVARIGSIRIYNASVSGANISEEKLIADNAFARGHIRLAIFCLAPYMTLNHGRKTAYMTPAEYWGALGSIQLLRDYVGAALARLRGSAPSTTENGAGRIDVEGNDQDLRWRGVRQRAEAPTQEFVVDEQAVKEYIELLRTAHARGARVVGFTAPVYAPVYAAQRAGYEEYLARMRRLFAPQDLVIDFNAPQYFVYTNDPATFVDGTHLSEKGAAYFSQELTRRLEQELGRPAPPHASAYRYSTNDATAPSSPRTLGLLDSMR